jgi:Holliday junction resolvase RusA-like endonuclease
VVKAVQDALNGVIYKDDVQIVSLHATKKYDMVPGVEILVKEELP